MYAGLYGSGGCAEFEYIAADDFPVFDLGWATVGISICSEMFVPEVARILALKGAEICLFPVGWTIDDLGWRDIWQTLVRARAIENVMRQRRAQSRLGDHCRPGIDSWRPNAGLLTADLDLARLRLMRRSQEFPDGLIMPPPFGSVPGVHVLRRPELTAPLLAAEAKTLPTIAPFAFSPPAATAAPTQKRSAAGG